MEYKLFDIEAAYYMLCFVAAFVLFFKLHKEGEPPFAVLGYINPAAAESAFGRFFEAILFAVNVAVGIWHLRKNFLAIIQH